MAIDVKCERDWQGPSDDTGTDDLLVVGCVRREMGHLAHVGLIEGEQTAIRVVYWISGTGTLYDYRTGHSYREQFAGEMS